MTKIILILCCILTLDGAFAQKKLTVNVKDYGAVGNGTTDDTKAFRSALQHLMSTPDTKVLYVPKGTYLLSKIFNEDFWAIKLIDNLQLVGEDKNSTILRLNPNTTSMTRIVYAQGVKNVLITNITFDGNRNNINLQKGLAYQMHGISINSSSNVRITNCNLVNTFGDGIGINGQETASTNIYISNCSFENNLRNGVTLGSGYNGVIIDSSTFKHVKVQPIDTEPQSGDCSNVTITGNVIYGDAVDKNIVTLGGYKLKTGSNIKVYNNTMYNCGFQLGNSSNTTLSNNKVVYDSSFKGDTRAIFYILGSNDSVTISNNEIHTQNIPVFLCFGLRDHFPKNIQFTQNTVYTNSYIPALFTCINAQDAVFEKNKIQSGVKNDLLFRLENQSIASKISFADNSVSNINTLFDIKNNFKTNNSELNLRKNQVQNAAIIKNNPMRAAQSRFSGYIINNTQ